HGRLLDPARREPDDQGLRRLPADVGTWGAAARCHRGRDPRRARRVRVPVRPEGRAGRPGRAGQGGPPVSPLAALVGLVTIVTSGLAPGLLTDRWRPSAAVRDAAAALGRVPREVDGWRGRDLEMDPAQLAMAGAAGHIYRRYEDRRTGAA